MKTRIDSPQRDRWALLRFAIIGPLLAAPPAPGELAPALEVLAARTWRHPLTGEPVQFGFSTLERWYYLGRTAQNPVITLRNRLHGNVGQFPSVTPRVIETLTTQYREHPGWTSQLHYDNLQAALQGQDVAVPSYPTIR
ncbi:IS481 family transposase, partial [Acidithiobacillus sp. MC6.1]|nr:IS481 family transposase [Acidithiobacillus sp. MC6.1]